MRLQKIQNLAVAAAAVAKFREIPYVHMHAKAMVNLFMFQGNTFKVHSYILHSYSYIPSANSLLFSYTLFALIRTRTCGSNIRVAALNLPAIQGTHTLATWYIARAWVTQLLY